MPNLGPGVPQNLNPAITPTWVFTPTPNAPATVRISNNSGNIVYVGGSNVSQFNGLPIPPNSRPIELQNITGQLYAASQVFAAGTVVTVPLAIAAGATSLTAASSTLATGPFIFGNSTGQEVVFGTISSNSVVTFANATLYDHAAGSTLATAIARPANITVTAGVV